MATAFFFFPYNLKEGKKGGAKPDISQQQGLV
jgi:hypothetical protein